MKRGVLMRLWDQDQIALLNLYVTDVDRYALLSRKSCQRHLGCTKDVSTEKLFLYLLHRRHFKLTDDDTVNCGHRKHYRVKHQSNVRSQVQSGIESVQWWTNSRHAAAYLKLRQRSAQSGHLFSPAVTSWDLSVLSGAATAAETQHQESFARQFTSTPVRFLVGQERLVYHVHSEVLRQQSPLFYSIADLQARARSRDGTTATEVKEIDWEDVTDCTVFDMFIEYLYQSEYSAPAWLGVAARCILFVRLFRLAEYTLMEHSKVSALKKLTDLLKENTSPSLRQALQPHEVLDLLEIAYGDAFGGTEAGTRASNVEQYSTACEVVEDADDVRPGLEARILTATDTPQERTDPLRQVIAKYSAVLIELSGPSAFSRPASARWYICSACLSLP